MPLKNEIKDFSKSIGIDVIGITSAEPFNDVQEIFTDRVKKGFYEDFDYSIEDVEFRCNPRNILSDAKSIISIAVSYNIHNVHLKEKKNSKKEKTTGIISKFALGIDYHKILKDKLEILADFIKKISLKNFKYKILVDTGPIVDRAVANRAGIGWYGKNCCIITKRFGSWIFLGEMITNLELESDDSDFKDCGDCDLCLRACPTQAIISPYIIDVRKCISNLTQKRGEIPMNLLEKMGGNIYGCDICQNVCPHNKETEFIDRKDFLPILQNGENIELSKIINMSEKEFKKWFGSSTIEWVGRNILRRNAIIALGNIGYPNSKNLLLKACEDKDYIIRKYADWAINKIEDR